MSGGTRPVAKALAPHVIAAIAYGTLGAANRDRWEQAIASTLAALRVAQENAENPSKRVERLMEPWRRSIRERERLCGYTVPPDATDADLATLEEDRRLRASIDDVPSEHSVRRTPDQILAAMRQPKPDAFAEVPKAIAVAMSLRDLFEASDPDNHVIADFLRSRVIRPLEAAVREMDASALLAAMPASMGAVAELLQVATLDTLTLRGKLPNAGTPQRTKLEAAEPAHLQPAAVLQGGRPVGDVVAGTERQRRLAALGSDTERCLATALIDNGPMLVKALASAVGLSPRTIGPVLKDMASRGQVWREGEKAPYCLGWDWRCRQSADK